MYVHGDSGVYLGGPAVQAVVMVIVVVVVIILGSRVGALVCSCWQGHVGTYAWCVFVRYGGTVIGEGAIMVGKGCTVWSGGWQWYVIGGVYDGGTCH